MVDYEEPFEAYGEGADITGVAGWYGVAGAGVISTAAQTYSGEFPIPSATHSNVLEITGRDEVKSLINSLISMGMMLLMMWLLMSLMRPLFAPAKEKPKQVKEKAE